MLRAIFSGYYSLTDKYIYIFNPTWFRESRPFNNFILQWNDGTHGHGQVSFSVCDSRHFFSHCFISLVKFWETDTTMQGIFIIVFCLFRGICCILIPSDRGQHIMIVSHQEQVSDHTETHRYRQKPQKACFWEYGMVLLWGGAVCAADHKMLSSFQLPSLCWKVENILTSRNALENHVAQQKRGAIVARRTLLWENNGYAGNIYTKLEKARRPCHRELLSPTDNTATALPESSLYFHNFRASLCNTQAFTSISTYIFIYFVLHVFWKLKCVNLFC